jgi:signal peptidase I
MRRWLAWLLGVVAVLAVTLGVLWWTSLLFPIGGGGGVSDAPTWPCKGRGLAEGFTYHFRDPRRGEFVVFHASGHLGGPITPDPDASGSFVKRVIGVPGDQVAAHGGRVYVNGVKSDDIATAAFTKVDLQAKQYFVLGDNRSFSQDSRDFGPVPRDAIFGRAFMIYWPLGHFGGLPAQKAGRPPGEFAC